MKQQLTKGQKQQRRIENFNKILSMSGETFNRFLTMELSSEECSERFQTTYIEGDVKIIKTWGFNIGGYIYEIK